MRATSVCFVLLTASIFANAGNAEGPATRTLELAPQTTIRYPEPWKPSGVKYSNAHELLFVAAPVKTEEAEMPSARILIMTEQRLNHQDAVNRLGDIAKSQSDATIRYVEIGGWPAVVLEFVAPLPDLGAPQKMGEDEEPAPQELMVQRALVAIAAATTVVHFDIVLAPEAPKSLLQQAEDIATSTTFPTIGNPEDVRNSILDLQRPVQKPRQPEVSAPVQHADLVHPPNRPVSPGHEVDIKHRAAAAAYRGKGELEVIASSNAKDIVIAGNGGLSYSNNRGVSFKSGSPGVFKLNDATLARGASGDFYLGLIATPKGTAAEQSVNGCTNAVNRSTDKGASFALQGYSVKCPQSGSSVCFPDQPHIAADSVNKASGNDQIYSIWRHKTPLSGSGPATSCSKFTGNLQTAISCSQDNGVTWTSPPTLVPGGDYPRIAVGKDGSVYVVTLVGSTVGNSEVRSVELSRYSSCANGLALQVGYPVTVATLTGQVACPVPGLDRCNKGNTLASPTVAPDPSDSKRVFVTFAESDNSGGEQIITLVSNNYGGNFFDSSVVTSSTSARRFMPWSCVAQGRSWVGWFDRQAATAPGATDDLTDFRLSSDDGTQVGNSYNLTQNPDPQCASGWRCGARNKNDSESCTLPHQLAGRCRNANHQGSKTPCDFGAPVCPSGETCETSGGCPKYGDYNGIACAGDYVVAVWSSATAPKGLPAVSGIHVFSEVMTVAPVCKVAAAKCVFENIFGVTVTCTREGIGIKYNGNCQLAGEPSPCYAGFDGSTSATASFEGTVGLSNSAEACTTDGPFQKCITVSANPPANQCGSGSQNTPPPPECPDGYRWCTRLSPPMCMPNGLCTYDPLHPPPQAPK